MRVLSVVGARPQFVKAAVLSRALAARGIEEWLVHTGQHYDRGMSDVFFEQLGIPEPRFSLGVGSAGHGAQTGEMMARLDPIVEEARPDWIVIYGDTNSTLAGALCGAKLHVPVAHVEAGLRSFDKRMPEEVNRLVADRVSDLLLAPTQHAAEQLRSEGITAPIEVVGDLMVDLALEAVRSLPDQPAVLDRFGLKEKSFALVTIHRASNTDDHATFARLIDGLRRIPMPVIFPVHPRTAAHALREGAGSGDNITLCEPLSYLETLALQQHARAVVTDSGGMQKEAVTLGTPCVTMRDTTEWTETLEHGWNVLVGSDAQRIAEEAMRPVPLTPISPYGCGGSAQGIVDALVLHRTREALAQGA